MEVLRGILLLECLAVGAFAGPISKQCDLKCIEPSGFRQGRTYIYSYHTETSSFLQRESYGVSNLTIACEVRLEAIGNCEVALELHDISVAETDRNGNAIPSPNGDEFASYLTRNRLRFGMQAGRVTAVCEPSPEPVWVTNFKRGVLSAVQLTLPSETPGEETISETTVIGTCPTVVTAEDASTVTKTKDFSKCEGRYNVHGQIPGIKLVPYAPSTEVITSHQSCRQEHNGNYVTESVCEEEHILMPISNPPTGPITTVRQVLTFQRVSKIPSNHALERIEQRSTISFDHSGYTMESKTDAAEANEIVSQICESLAGGVDTETARLFPALINEMRRLESGALASVLADADCEKYQRTLHRILADALGECQSTGCISIMVNLIQDNTVTNQETIQKWIISLNFVNHPTKEMVSHLMELAEVESVRRSLYLAVSSVINKYCSLNPDCQSEPEISQAMSYFEAILTSRCRYEDREEKRKMIITLRAIGNAGLPSRAPAKCYESESTDAALRVAAMQAAQQMPCDSQDQEGLIGIMQKDSEDAELRISAYKALMACPSMDLLDVIDALLEEEISNQVGGYIVSHLKNLQDSQDPLKTAQRALLEDHPITAKFLEDPTKFSHNAEWSWYNGTSGYGLAGEGDVIFSSNSFMPRQVSVKGQFDAFGYAFEAFEFGGRMEGLQNLIESVFGPGAEEEGSTRQRRSMIKESKMQKVIEDFEVTGDSEADGSLYLKMFGREVMFMDAEDIKAMFAPKDTNEMIMELVQLATGKTYEFSRSSMMIEKKLSIPLVNGLEMKVSANTSSTERLNITGKLDIMTMEINGTIEPSAAMDVSCLMEVDAHCARTGVRYELSAHSATSLSGKVSLEEGNNFKLELRAPEHKQEIVSYSSKMTFLHQEEFDPAPSGEGITFTEENVCTGEYLENAIGFKLCGDSKYHEYTDRPGEPPLSGAYEFSLTAEKVDMDLTSFDVEVSYGYTDETEVEAFHLMLGTPGTSVDRTYGVDWTFNYGTRSFSMDLTCPHHRSQIMGSRLNDENNQELTLTWIMDDESQYSMHFGFQKEISSDESNYYPTLRVVSPQFGTLELEGSVINTDSRVSLDVSLQGESRKFITINGVTTKSKRAKKSLYSTTLTVGGEYIDGSIVSEVQIRGDVVSFDATLSRESPLFGDQRSLTISARHRDTRGDTSINQDFYVSCAFSHSPELSFRLDGDVEATRDGNSESSFKFCYGQTGCSGSQKIMLSHTLAMDRTEENHRNHFTLALQHPAQGTHLVLSQTCQSGSGRNEFTIDVTDRGVTPSQTLVASRLGMVHVTDDDDVVSGSYEVSLTTADSIKRLNQTWEVKIWEGDVLSKTIVQWQPDQWILAAVSYSPEEEWTRHNVDVHLSNSGEMVGRVHTHVQLEASEGQAEFGVYDESDEEVMLLRGTGSRAAESNMGGGSGSVLVHTPFNILGDFEVMFGINRYESTGFDSTLSLTLLPEEDVYSLFIQEEKSDTDSMKRGTGIVRFALPSTSFAMTGFAENNREVRQRKGGLELEVMTEDSEGSIFGIEASFHDRSTDSRKDFLVRVNTTAPYHKNTIDLTLTGDGSECSCELDVEYSTGKHFVTGVTYSKKRNNGGFTVGFGMRAPYQKAVLDLDHTRGEGLFHPHLSLEVSSFDVDMTLLDVDLMTTVNEGALGKDSLVVLKLTGPSKTVILSTGIARTESGLNYHLELANEDEVRYRMDLTTAISLQGDGFITNIDFTASTIYLPEWPIHCGLHLERGVEDVIFVTFFDLDEPMFHFNVTQSVTAPSPNAHKEDITVRVKIPTSIQPSLHDFGMHVSKEERTTLPGNIPVKDGSLSFFWGPATNQQLTMSYASSVQNNEDGVVVEGSLVLAQPLRVQHLHPEYSLDYSLRKEGPELEFSVTYDLYDDDTASLSITHNEQEKDGLPNYITSVTATLHEGKSFNIAADITRNETRHVMGSIVFTMDDGDHHEEAELTIDSKDLSEDRMAHSSVVTFHHTPSELGISAVMDIHNNDLSMYFGLEGQCQFPALDSALNFGFSTELDKETETLVVHAKGPVNDIILRGSIGLDVGENGRMYRVVTDNEINGVKRPLSVSITYQEDHTTDLVLRTNAGDQRIRIHYLNDSSIQATLNNDEDENAQSTLTIINPHTLFSLTTWDVNWPATVKEAVLERINAMKERRIETFERYQEIWDAIWFDFIIYMEQTMLRNEELITQTPEIMAEIGEGLRERFQEIRVNYRLQRVTIQEKFENFGERFREGLEPLAEEYREMTSAGSEHVEMVGEHILDSTASYFENAARSLFAYRMAVLGAVVDHVMECEETLMENLELDREMISINSLYRRTALPNWVRAEVDWMRQNWEDARDDLQERWEEFVNSMSDAITNDELANLKLEFQSSPAYTDMVQMGLTLIEADESISEKLNAYQEEKMAQRELRGRDVRALRAMKEHLKYVQSAPLFGTHDVEMPILGFLHSTFFYPMSVSYQEKIDKLVAWAIEQSKGYSIISNIEEGKMEVWWYTDERYDDLMSLPVQDPLSRLKVFGARLSKDFPLIDDLRQFKSGLYEDNEIEMSYFESVAQPSYNAIVGGSSGVTLEDLWEWNGLINVALYKIMGTQCPKGEAALIGDQHYKTFDGTYYAFARKCSFLLAQDFVDNNFTVAVEYGRDENVMTKSFVVIADGVTLEIRNGGVFIGRDQLEFPHSPSESLYVTRDFSSIYITSTKGFTVTYDLQHDIFRVRLSLLYFGKTAGLFGNFNHEPTDDFTSAKGQLVRTEVFARSWEIGRQCTSHLNKAVTCDNSPEIEENFACGAMFLDGLGPASMGHPAVNPEPFYDACVNSICGNFTHERQLAKRCDVFQAYIDACEHKGLRWLQVPEECVQCTDSPPRWPGLNWVEVPRGADIIILLEEQPCMAEKQEAIVELMEAVNHQLRTESYRSNRIGIVGFGGSGNNQKAHVQSIDGELFGGIDRLEYALNHMSFDGEGVGDVWGAISLAMDYPFRAGVAKHVFLVACTECSKEARSFGFAAVQRAMDEQDVRFTVLMEQSITLGARKKKNENDIYGYNQNSVFTDKLKDVSTIDEFKGDTSLIDYIVKPKNSCTGLAMTTEGAVFSTSSFGSKSFENVFALWVVKNTEVDTAGFCRCSMNRNGSPQSICNTF